MYPCSSSFNRIFLEKRSSFHITFFVMALLPLLPIVSLNTETLEMKDNYYFNFTLGVDKDSAHPGGINLFGRDFGNHRQDLLMKVVYK
ncbi:MAG: hypothetical protein K0S04_3232 [Herbinix sp.]|nr:hypothetical protein [Herbinix sp.]